VGGLVRVDAGVLDDHVPGHSDRRGGIGRPLGHVPRERGPVEEDVHVAPARHLRLAHAGRLRELRGQALRDVARLLAQGLGQVERVRSGRGRPAPREAGTGRRPRPGPRRRQHEPPRAPLRRAGMDVEDHRKTRSGGKRASLDYSVPTTGSNRRFRPPIVRNCEHGSDPPALCYHRCMISFGLVLALAGAGFAGAETPSSMQGARRPTSTSRRSTGRARPPGRARSRSPSRRKTPT
jgi:hypothetical protein